MSRYEWIENEALEKIADRVYEDTYNGKYKSEFYDLKIRTDYELLIIFDALNNLSKYVKGKREAGSRAKDPKKDMLKKIEDIGNALYGYGLVDEYHNLMLIKAKVKQHKTITAKQYATSIAKNVENSLHDAGTSNKRIKQIKRFITEAVIAVAKNPSHYKDDLHELSKAFTNN